jgi:hypothetical protein
MTAKEIADKARGVDPGDISSEEDPVDFEETGRTLAKLHHKAIMSGDPDEIWSSHKAMHSAATLALEHQKPDKDSFEEEASSGE